MLWGFVFCITYWFVLLWVKTVFKVLPCRKTGTGLTAINFLKPLGCWLEQLRKSKFDVSNTFLSIGYRQVQKDWESKKCLIYTCCGFTKSELKRKNLMRLNKHIYSLNTCSYTVWLNKITKTVLAMFSPWLFEIDITVTHLLSELAATWSSVWNIWTLVNGLFFLPCVEERTNIIPDIWCVLLTNVQNIFF